MKNKKYINNIKLLIDSNLLFLDSLNKSKNSLNHKNFPYLNVLECVKNLKQIIRSLQFLRNRKHSILYLESNNEILEEMIDLIKNKKKNVSINLFDVFLFKPKTIKKDQIYPKIYIYASQYFFTNKYFKFLFLNKFYIINCIHSDYQKQNLGFYKFYNDLISVKKVFFFLLILKKNI